MRRIVLSLLGLLAAMSASAQTNVLTVAPTRSSSEVSAAIDLRAREFARNMAALSRGTREAYSRATGRSREFSMPVRIQVAGTMTPRGRGPGDLNLVFDSSGPRAFPTAYRTLLETTFANAQATMNLFFGNPAIGGDVLIRNYDADIGDRDAVAGGVYVPNNGSGQREIRFPIYQSDEAAAVNFIHTLLLAYQGDKLYAFDGFQEGLVRAATMRVVRTPTAITGLDSDKIEETLAATYDVGPHYDWFNQRALSGPQFIASNLRDAPLPTGGSLGGSFLLRYQMAGSAWTKVLSEYPGFIAAFNVAYQAWGGSPTDVEGLTTLARTVMETLAPAPASVEGVTVSEWTRRQAILDPNRTSGPKLLVEPIPITSGLVGTDFGVFLIQTTYFATAPNGDETLLTGTSYPIFWDGTFNRIFPDSQSERMDIAAAYGSVAPNFPNQNANRPYRVLVDVPVQDQIARVSVPAGAVATAVNPTPNDFYGTVIGVPSVANTSLVVRLTIGSEVIDDIAVQDNAFGVRLNNPNFAAQRSLLVDLFRVPNGGGARTLLFSRRVNKGPGKLAVTLEPGAWITRNFSAGLPAGISAFGLPLDPVVTDASRSFAGGNFAGMLRARYNPSKARYDLGPEVEPFKVGNGYFLRLPQASGAFTVFGRVATTDATVALRPGWNLITVPIDETVTTARVQVVRTVGFPRSWAEAAGEDIGLDFFAFTPGASDPNSGLPETGTFAAATQFVPGQAYFVRCLSPEGVTLLFQTTGGAGRSVGALRPQWAMSVIATSRDGTSRLELGMDGRATLSVDRGFDSDLPPSLGGFQLASEGNLYRDIRDLRGSQTFSFRANGLRRGQAVTLSLAPQGTFRTISVIDSDGRKRVFSTPQIRWTFRPRSDSAQFRVTVEGAR